MSRISFRVNMRIGILQEDSCLIGFFLVRLYCSEPIGISAVILGYLCERACS